MAKKNDLSYDELLSKIRELEDKNNLLESINNHTQVYKAYIDPKTMKYVYVNKGFERSFNIPREKIIGMHVKELLGEESFKFVKKYLAKVKKGECTEYEKKFDLEDGAKWLKVKYTPHFNTTKELAGIIVTSYDITDLKKITDELSGKQEELKIQNIKVREQNKNLSETLRKLNNASGKLKESEEFYRVTLNAISDAILMTDKKGKITYIGPNAESMFGMSRKQIFELKSIGVLLNADLFSYEEIKRKKEIKNVEYKIDKANSKSLVLIATHTAIDLGEHKILHTIRDITEITEAKEALVYSETKLLMAIESTGLGLWDQDFLSGKVFRNTNWYEMLGYSANEVNSSLDSWLTLIHPDDLQDVRIAVEEHESGKSEIFSVDHRMKTKDGDYKWIKNWGKIISWLDDKKPLRAIGVHMDISGKKDAELAAKQTELKYKTLYDGIPMAIFRSTPQGEVLSCNYKMLDIYGYDSQRELLERPAIEFYKDAGDREIILQNLKEKGHCKEFITKELKKDNSEIWIKTDYFCTKKANGDIEYIDGVAIDITEQKGVQDALAESEKRYRELVEQIPDSIIIHTDETIKYVNEAAVKLANANSKIEMVGKKVSSFYQPVNQESTSQYMQRLLNGDKNLFPVEDEYVKSDGTNVAVEVHAELITYEGKPAVQLMIRDITMRKDALKKEKIYYENLEDEVNKRTEEINKQAVKLKESQIALSYLLEDVNGARKELLDINTELEAANTDLESFAYSVSHDLRAPLRHIDGFTQILENKINSDKKDVHNYFDKIHNASKRMHDLINDLLTFSRLGRKKLKLTYVNVNKIINEIIKIYEPDIKLRNIKWEIETLPIIQADAELLKICLDNLLSNALKFTSNEKVAKIKVGSLNISKKKVEIYVEDNGVGFDMEYVHKLFGVFERLHPSDEFPGTGIGLANVKRIIQSHKGKVVAMGTPDKGARFSFILPETQ